MAQKVIDNVYFLLNGKHKEIPKLSTGEQKKMLHKTINDEYVNAYLNENQEQFDKLNNKIFDINHRNIHMKKAPFSSMCKYDPDDQYYVDYRTVIDSESEKKISDNILHQYSGNEEAIKYWQEKDSLKRCDVIADNLNSMRDTSSDYWYPPNNIRCINNVHNTFLDFRKHFTGPNKWTPEKFKALKKEHRY